MSYDLPDPPIIDFESFKDRNQRYSMMALWNYLQDLKNARSTDLTDISSSENKIFANLQLSSLTNNTLLRSNSVNTIVSTDIIDEGLGEIDFSANDLITTGAISGGILTDGTASISSGAVTGIASLDGGGTINLEDNLDGTGFTITGGTLTDGTASMTAGSLTGLVDVTLSNELIIDTYITAVTANRWGKLSIEDSDDYIHLTREDANILGFKVDMDLQVWHPSLGADDYVSITHDSNQGILRSGSGDMLFQGASFTLDALTSSSFIFRDNGTNAFRIVAQIDWTETKFMTYYDTGNQICISNSANAFQKHDHGTTTNPTLFIQDDSSPGVSNNKWGSLYHNGTGFVIDSGIETGVGTSPATIDNYISIQPRGVETFRFLGTGPLLALNAIYLTQTDGNEYIDSLADDYTDVGATTGIRLNSPLTRVTGDLYVGNNADVDPVIIFDGDTSDFTIKLDEDNGNLLLSSDAGTNHTKIEADGTIVFVGTATVYDDLNFDPTRSGGPVATRPDDVTINNVLHKEFTSANNQFCGAVEELPHTYKLSATLSPHIHIFLKSGESAGATGVTFTFYWELRQSTGTTSGSVTLSATSAQLGTTAGANSFLISGTAFAGSAELGAQLAVTIARTAGDAGDIVLTTYGVHYEIDMLGSRTITSK